MIAAEAAQILFEVSVRVPPGPPSVSRTRMLPAGKGAPANLWLGGKNVVPGNYRLTIAIQAGPQRWTQVVAIRYLR